MGDGKTRRLAELDGLRGLAALSVFFCHAGMFGPPWNVLAFLGDGSAAVDLFFVLSGFVLARSLLARRQNYWEFVWRRVARLYPAYWGAVLVALALMISSNRAGLAPLGDLHVWAKPITVEQLIKHFFLITPSIDVHWANYSIWSLVVEMRISLLFPLLLVGLVSLPGLARWSVLLLSPALALVPMFLLGIGHVPLFLLGLAPYTCNHATVPRRSPFHYSSSVSRFISRRTTCKWGSRPGTIRARREAARSSLLR